MVERKANPGIQDARLRLLLRINSAPMLSMSTLGRLLYISKPHMTTLVDALVIEGLVERHYDESDRRVINISITQKGREEIQLFQYQVRNLIQNRISTLPECELVTLYHSGEKFLEIVFKIP